MFPYMILMFAPLLVYQVSVTRQENRNGKECKNSFISMDTLCGYVPQVGDVLDIYYNDRGFIDTVVPDLTRRCKFIIENVSLKN